MPKLRIIKGDRMEIAVMGLLFVLVGIIFAIERLINVLKRGEVTFKTVNHLNVRITHPKEFDVQQDNVEGK